MNKILDLFTPEQEGILKDEAFQTVRTGADFIQWGAGEFVKNPLRSAGIIALVVIAFSGIKLKMADILDIKF